MNHRRHINIIIKQTLLHTSAVSLKQCLTRPTAAKSPSAWEHGVLSQRTDFGGNAPSVAAK